MTKLQQYLAGGLALIVLMGLGYCAGDKHGHLNEKLSANKMLTHVSDSITKSVQIRTDGSRRNDSALSKKYDLVRTKIGVVHDTITVGDSIDIVSPEIAAVLLAADSTIAAQKRSLALQDTLIGSLRVGLDLRDKRISLLEKQHSPRLGIKSGVAIGAVSTVALVVVAVKVIQAIHK